MANTIKHKRGSGSNPSASDLVAGELAIRTDTGVVFTKKMMARLLRSQVVALKQSTTCLML